MLQCIFLHFYILLYCRKSESSGKQILKDRHYNNQQKLRSHPVEKVSTCVSYSSSKTPHTQNLKENQRGEKSCTFMMAEKSPKVQSKKISLCGGCTILGELPPEDPVCDSGIFCYGKKNL